MSTLDDVRPRVWCRLACELVAFCATLPVIAPSSPPCVTPFFPHKAIPVIRTTTVPLPFPSEDLEEEPGGRWVLIPSTAPAASATTYQTEPTLLATGELPNAVPRVKVIVVWPDGDPATPRY